MDDVQLETSQDATSSRSRSTTITSSDSAAILSNQPVKGPPIFLGGRAGAGSAAFEGAGGGGGGGANDTEGSFPEKP